MNEQEKLKALLERVGNPDAAPLSAQEMEWLEDFRSRYPFFSLTAEDPSGLTSPEAHARIAGSNEARRFDGFYPPENEQQTPTTLAAIDDFLNTYGHQSPEEDQLLERLIFNPIPDYAQQLAAEAEASMPAAPAADADSQDARIDRFILKQKASQTPETPTAAAAPQQTPAAATVPPQTPAAATAPPQTPAEPVATSVASAAPKHVKKKTAENSPAPGLLSESLAKIYIKTRRYERAYEILNDLSLRFPEKSRYFADQLRFLRKLIINEQQRKAAEK